MPMDARTGSGRQTIREPAKGGALSLTRRADWRFTPSEGRAHLFMPTTISKPCLLVGALVAMCALSGCEYAIGVNLSGRSRTILAKLDDKSANEIVRKNLAATPGQLGFHAFDFESLRNQTEFQIAGEPTNVSLVGSVIHFKAGPNSEHRLHRQHGSVADDDPKPIWFTRSEYEFDLTKVDYVVLWDPIHLKQGMRTGPDIELSLDHPSSTPDGQHSIWVQVASTNVQEFMAALKYWSPGVTFTAAR